MALLSRLSPAPPDLGLCPLRCRVHNMGKTSVPCIVPITCRHLAGTPDSSSRR